MREIKFRCWNGSYMDYEPSFYGDTIQGEAEPSPINEIFKTDGSEIYMQFTGLLDKNGKEIYEGDILDDQHHCNQHFQVKWIDRLAGFYQKDIVKPPDSFGFGKPDYELNKENCLLCEIIGNIYENPELLENKK